MIRQRSSDSARLLREFGQQAKAGMAAGKAAGRRARIEIRAPSDAAGRWMYQQLNDTGNSMATGARLRGSLIIGSPPQVELVVFDIDAPSDDPQLDGAGPN